jgi:hypothetical protein
MLKKWWIYFVANPIALTLSQASWFGFVLTTILLASLVNVATSVLIEVSGSTITLIVMAFVTLAALIYANVYAYRVHDWTLKGRQIIGGHKSPAPCPGLILMVTRAPTMRKAIEYHAVALKHLWLIVTPDMENAANELRELARRNEIHPHNEELAEPFDADACYHVVRRIYEEQVAALKLPRSAVIADITGGTKPMTAGMVLACTNLGARLEHVPAYFADGKALTPLDPIEIVLG